METSSGDGESLVGATRRKDKRFRSVRGLWRQRDGAAMKTRAQTDDLDRSTLIWQTSMPSIRKIIWLWRSVRQTVRVLRVRCTSVGVDVDIAGDRS